MKQVKDRSFFWNTIIYLIAAGLFILVLFALPASSVSLAKRSTAMSFPVLPLRLP